MVIITISIVISNYPDFWTQRIFASPPGAALSLKAFRVSAEGAGSSECSCGGVMMGSVMGYHENMMGGILCFWGWDAMRIWWEYHYILWDIMRIWWEYHFLVGVTIVEIDMGDITWYNPWRIRMFFWKKCEHTCFFLVMVHVTIFVAYIRILWGIDYTLVHIYITRNFRAMFSKSTK